jgi:hypothetical protein
MISIRIIPGENRAYFSKLSWRVKMRRLHVPTLPRLLGLAYIGYKCLIVKVTIAFTVSLDTCPNARCKIKSSIS